MVGGVQLIPPPADVVPTIQLKACLLGLGGSWSRVHRAEVIVRVLQECRLGGARGLIGAALQEL